MLVEPITVVSGMGRCGTTAMMGALRAGGMPVMATPGSPLNEYVRPPGETWGQTMVKAQGKAIKVLNGLAPLGKLYAIVPTRVIWMMRDTLVQARSTRKLLEAIRPGEQIDSVLEIQQDIERRQPIYIGMIERLGCDIILVQYESLVETPRRVVDAVVDWLGDTLDRRAMTESIYIRSPDLYPGFLEKELYERRTGECVPISALDTRTLANGAGLRALPAEGQAPGPVPGPSNEEADSAGGGRTRDT